jgi:predicted RNase H-like HicB family nuclease
MLSFAAGPGCSTFSFGGRRGSIGLCVREDACFRNRLAYSLEMAFPLTAYIEGALEMARYDKLEDGSFSGEIPKLKGIIAFAESLRECENELRSTLEDWILVGLRLGHKLPVIGGIDLNQVKNGRLAPT